MLMIKISLTLRVDKNSTTRVVNCKGITQWERRECCAPLGVLVLIARVHAIVICLGLDIQFQTLILIYISNFGLCCIALKYASYRITLHIKQDIYFKIQIIGTASSCIVLKLN